MPTKRTTRRTSTGFGGYRTTNRKSTSRTTKTGYKPTNFTTQKNAITAKIGSFRNLNQQVSGSTSVAFSPTTANKFISLVNNGNFVYKFSGQQFSKVFGAQFTTDWNNTTALKALRGKFGTGIKAVVRGRGNNWLVAASPNVKGAVFRNYKW